jgi:Cd2+/Zn2+-exporting ATPase
MVILTGDSEETARAIAAELGVDEWRAGLLPEEKVGAIGEFNRKYGKIAMVGDGVNDAPAMAAASVGIAMGATGTDVALETADVALMADDLSKLPYLFQLSRASGQVIQQNVWAAILVKFTLPALCRNPIGAEDRERPRQTALVTWPASTLLILGL